MEFIVIISRDEKFFYLKNSVEEFMKDRSKQQFSQFCQDVSRIRNYQEISGYFEKSYFIQEVKFQYLIQFTTLRTEN